MESQEPPSTLRFIKKLPPSGVAKLTLPHVIVTRRLQHFVDKEFELASSPFAQQTWSGSIAVRKNKGRNEYVLQGWRLFCEAFNFQPGDHVSFELVDPKRLVVKCIQPSGHVASASGIRRSEDSPDPEIVQPAKVQKESECGSPSRKTSQIFHKMEESGCRRVQPIQTYPSSKDAVSPPQRVSSPLTPALPHFAQQVPIAGHSDEDHQEPRVQSWIPLASPTRQAHSPRSTTSSLHDAEQIAMQAKSLTADATHFNEYHISPPSHMDWDLPGLFDDVCTDLDAIIPGDVHPFAPTFAKREQAGMYPAAPLAKTTHSSDPFPQASGIHPPDPNSRVTKARERLDQSTRAALQATMGIETCAVELSRVASGEMQATMFKFLSTLKGSLWELLMVATPNETS